MADILYDVTLVKLPWTPYSAELAAEFLGWPVEEVRAEYGATVLIRPTLSGYEFGRPAPAPDSAEVRAEVTEIAGEPWCLDAC